ncbi:MAG: Na/Pi cotransporter family protein [Bacteroidales bacterium]|nr:Na/Pi cotransporter family protein [Bacteroidales bacterium]
MKKILLICIFIFIAIFQTKAQDSCLIISKPSHTEFHNFSGDNQFGKPGQYLINPIKVNVSDKEKRPAAGVTVYFTFVSVPNGAKNQEIYNKEVVTNKAGLAYTFIKPGSKPGDYYVQAKIKENCLENDCLFRITAREPNWVFLLIIGLLGGLGLFLYGMHIMSNGMQKSAGEKMRAILSSLTRNRFVGVGVGTFVTVLIQSSSATTVMLVGFVNSKLITFTQTLGVILGASIGTTITAQVIAFKLTDYALLFIALGFLFYIISNKEKIKHIGEAILGFGILFYGMHIMSTAMYPLRNYEPFLNLLIRLEDPVIGILIGIGFTALIQSSGAFIGIMVVLASQGFLSLESAIPLVLGSNIGTSITAILASLNASTDAKKVALAHTLFKFIGVLLVIWWLPGFGEFVTWISPKSSAINSIEMTQEELPRQIANAHTLFNVALTLILLPFTGFFGKLIDKIIRPKKKAVPIESRLKYLNNAYFPTPVLALNMAKQEIMEMSKTVVEMLHQIVPAFLEKDNNLIKKIEENEENVDYVVENIKNYLINITRNNVNKERVNEAFQMIYTVKELEQIADVISTNMLKHAIEWAGETFDFSEEGKKEIREFHTLTIQQLQNAIEVFMELNLHKALTVKDKHKAYRKKADELELLHYERLRKNVPESIESSKYHIELINMLKIIIRHSSNICRIILDRAGQESTE